jgi:hypothetical protein
VYSWGIFLSWDDVSYKEIAGRIHVGNSYVCIFFCNQYFVVCDIGHIEEDPRSPTKNARKGGPVQIGAIAFPAMGFIHTTGEHYGQTIAIAATA